MIKRSSFTIFKSVVIALFLREVQTRFGTKKLGYFWAVFDAMFMVMIFAGLKSLISSQSMAGIDYPVYLATTFLAFFLWRNIVKSGMNAFSANKALFAYKQVKPFDTLVTRLFLEMLVSSVATLVFIGIGLYIGLDLSIKDFNMVMLAVLWLCIFGFAIGLMSAVFSYFYEFYAKVMNVLLSPLMFVSAIMYSVKSLPPMARDIVLLNPLTHFMEMIHGFYFYALDTQYVDYEYMLYWTLIPLWIGLFFYIRSEKRILMS
ncbi:Capsular polysaccharide ABC transporter, permease protein KpsM [hydrothermal vent metagenome]|uniref:Capsular polysaccharide ABC transporter, permease protein KpsM n=1 Tax=hydrothermal vent metagenome TaxID=652676 RepID=A0A1W1D536_9ZZZZ